MMTTFTNLPASQDNGKFLPLLTTLQSYLPAANVRAALGGPERSNFLLLLTSLCLLLLVSVGALCFVRRFRRIRLVVCLLVLFVMLVSVIVISPATTSSIESSSRLPWAIPFDSYVPSSLMQRFTIHDPSSSLPQEPGSSKLASTPPSPFGSPATPLAIPAGKNPSGAPSVTPELQYPSLVSTPLWFEALVIFSTTVGLLLATLMCIGLVMCVCPTPFRAQARMAAANLFLYARHLFCCGTERELSEDRARNLDGVTLIRDNFIQDQDHQPAAGGAPQNPEPPLVQVMVPHGQHQLVGPYSIHVSYQLKAEGLGSMGQDTADNRRIAALRAADIMKKHGVRPSHIAKSIPMAVALAFTPLPEEVAAAQLPAVQRAAELKEAVARRWLDPRTLGGVPPTLAFN